MGGVGVGVAVGGTWVGGTGVGVGVGVGGGGVMSTFTYRSAVMRTDADLPLRVSTPVHVIVELGEVAFTVTVTSEPLM